MKHENTWTNHQAPTTVSFYPGGVLLEFLGGDVPLGPWNPSPIPELIQLNFATLY